MFTNYDEKQTKEMLKNFIEDDLDCDDEDEDEDYDEMKDFNFENEKKTNMEKIGKKNFLVLMKNLLQQHP